jgi:hypothetical protein
LSVCYGKASKGGKWKRSTGNFRARSLEQDEKDVIVAGLRKISADFPGIVIVPGSIAWRKPLVRTGAAMFVRDEVTGERTDTLKASDRLAKNTRRIAEVGDFGQGGKMKANTYLYDAV